MSSDNEHNAFVRWKHTKLGRLFWAILTAIFAYVSVSLAINSGSLLQWGFVALFTADSIYNLVQLARMYIGHGGNPDKA